MLGRRPVRIAPYGCCVCVRTRGLRRPPYSTTNTTPQREGIALWLRGLWLALGNYSSLTVHTLYRTLYLTLFQPYLIPLFHPYPIPVVEVEVEYQ